MADATLISVVDDDASLCQAVTGLLRSFGYEARGFTSAESFLAWEGAGGCACIVTDVHMPGISGFDLKDVLAARRQHVPMILITARSDAAAEARAESTDAVCFLPKPFPPEALIGCIEKALGR